jgi:hypothetical protein
LGSPILEPFGLKKQQRSLKGSAKIIFASVMFDNGRPRGHIGKQVPCQKSWGRLGRFFQIINNMFIELDDGNIYRKALYLMVKTMVSCRFSLKPIH